MHDDVLHAPLGQQEHVGRDADGAFFDVAFPPAGDERPVVDKGGLDAHELGVALHHRLHECYKPVQGLVELLLCAQGQLVVEVGALLLPFVGVLSCLGYPLAVFFNELVYFFAGNAERHRHVHVVVLSDAHRHAAGATIGDEDGHGREKGEVISDE